MSIARGMFHTLGKRLPTVEGQISTPELHAPVSIRRDSYGVPHINAINDHDAWFALGFCQAQDRSFQLETIIRCVRGTMSEILGVDGLPIDRMVRRVGIHRAAVQQYAVLDDDIREMIDAFTSGINAGRQRGTSRQAHEFTMLHIPPTEWTPADVLGHLKFISLVISTNWAEELSRYMTLIEDSIAGMEALEPGSTAWLPVTSPPDGTAGRAAASLMQDAWRVVDALGIDRGGSNAWALSGQRTASGRPILANDHHLSPSIPTHYHLAHLTTPEWAVAGGAFVGTPGFFAGHNGHAAWGVTVGYLDNADLFIEEIGPDGRSVREGDRFAPCTVRPELIHVRAADDITEVVLETPRGPIIGPALDGRPGSLSLSATWLQPSRARSAFGAPKWRSYEDFRQDIDLHPQLSLNFVYADASGDIGWALAGQQPPRSGSGALPLPAWEPAHHWHGEPKPPDERLRMKNPETGYLASANNRPIPQAENAGLGVDWQEGYRLKRILELLTERDDWDVESSLAMQLDVHTIPWREIQPFVRAVDPVDDDCRAAKFILQYWDGNVRADSTAASLYETFVAILLQKIAERAAPVTWKWALGQGGGVLSRRNALGNVRHGYLIRLLRQQPDGWFHNGWDQAIAHSLGDSLRLLRVKAGYRVRSWRWGKMRQLQLTHTVGRGPFGQVFNRGAFPIAGDSHTINSATVRPTDPFGSPGATATIRMVVEVGAWDDARFALLGGQSGNPLSRHYDDQIEHMLNGDTIRIAWTPEAVERAAEHTLTLVPEDPQTSA